MDNDILNVNLKILDGSQEQECVILITMFNSHFCFIL